MNNKFKFTFLKSKKLILLLILLLGIFFRTIGFNWDQKQHLHPDERFLTMTVGTIQIPDSFKEYLDPQKSSLNPYNHNYLFFVYGAFPINIVRLIAEENNLIGYHQIHFIGRFLTILLDVSIIFLLYLTAKNILNSKLALLSTFIYSISVLPIQLSHFYTVDPFLNFFIFLSFYLLTQLFEKKNKPYSTIIFLSLSFSLALASKISAIYFLPVIFLSFIFIFFKDKKKLLLSSFLFILLIPIFTRFFQPQLFNSGNFLDWQLNPQFISNIKELQSYNQNKFYPPGIQWLQTTPILFPLKNILLWGLGLPLSFFFVLSLIYLPFHLKKEGIKKNFFIFLSFFYFLYLLITQGYQQVTTMRYFLPLYPFISLLIAFTIYHLYFGKLKLYKSKVINIFLIIFLLIYPLSFISIYSKDHSRVVASKWIYQNIPHQSTLAVEYWDDPLPLLINSSFPNLYNYQTLNVASPDTKSKIAQFKAQLVNTDYIILSSNRFYLPIPQHPDLFPFTSKYYKYLFDGSLGFKKINEFTSYPSLTVFNKTIFTLNDTYAEEAFTVYDHPKVVIFQKTEDFNLTVFE